MKKFKVFFFLLEKSKCSLAGCCLKKSFRMLVVFWASFFLKMLQFKKMCLTQRGTLNIEHEGVNSFWWRCE